MKLKNITFKLIETLKNVQSDRVLSKKIVDAVIDARQYFLKFKGDARVSELYREIENVRDPEDVTVTCKKGCSFCCYIGVSVSKEEADLIKSFGVKPNQERLTKQLEVLPQDLKREDIVSTWEKISYQDRACIFLKDNECSIYEARPLICRTYKVASPAENCNRKDGAKEVAHVNSLKAEIISTGYLQTVKELKILPLWFDE